MILEKYFFDFGHMYSYVKLNFRVGFFLAFFDLSPSSAVFLAFYIYPFLHGKNGQNKPENQQN